MNQSEQGRTRAPQSREEMYRVGRIVAAAMAMGVAALYGVALFITDGGAKGISPGMATPQEAMWAWAVVAVASFVAALLFRGRALRVVEQAQRRGAADEVAAQAPAVWTNLLIAWAMLESAALLAGLIVLLLGDERILWYAVPLYGLGLILTFPRPEWFGLDPRR